MDNSGRKMSKPPGSERFNDDELDVLTGFADNEKIFLATMKNIFQKYEQPFLNDNIINLDDYTYDTPAGQHPRDFKNNISDVSSVDHLSQKTSSFKKCQDRSPFRKLAPSDSPEERPSQLSKKKLPSILGVKQSSDQTCSTLMQYKEDQNSDLSVLSNVLHVAFPHKAKVSEEVNRFDMNSECFLKYPGRYNVVVSKADDSGPSVNEEASYSDPGNKTLEDIYPQMIESLTRLWGFNIKNQAADNIVRHYRRQFWSKNKKVLGMKMNCTYTISSAPPIFKEIVTPSKTYNSTMLPEKCLSKSGLREPIKGSSPILFSEGQKFSSHPVSITMTLNPQDYASKTFEGIIDNWPIAIPKPIPAQQHKDKNSIMPPNYSSWSSSSDTTMSPSKAMTTQHQMAIERNHASYREDTKQLQNRTRTLTTSSSPRPMSHNASRDFESLYRNLTLNRTQLNLSPGNAQAQLSKAVQSLVNSPGSQTAKRSISHDFSFSPVKKPRNATESLTGSSKPIYKSMDSSHVSWLESSSSNLHHSVVASPLATHMLPHSPLLLRSFPRVVNDRSPIRTNQRYSKKHIQEAKLPRTL